MKLRREGETALGDVVVSIFPSMALSTTFDAGACILVETVVRSLRRSRLCVEDEPTEMAGPQLRFARPAAGGFA